MSSKWIRLQLWEATLYRKCELCQTDSFSSSWKLHHQLPVFSASRKLTFLSTIPKNMQQVLEACCKTSFWSFSILCSWSLTNANNKIMYAQGTWEHHLSLVERRSALCSGLVFSHGNANLSLEHEDSNHFSAEF